MTEAGVVAGNAHVARQGQIEPAAEAVAANCGEHRLGTSFNRAHQRLAQRRKAQSLYRSERADFREVGARGKRLRRAGDDCCANRGIRWNAFDSHKHLPQDGTSEAGKLVGTFERNKKDGAAQIETNGGIHCALSLLALGHAVLNELYDVLRGRAGKKNFSNAGLFEGGNVRSGNNAADEHRDIAHTIRAQQIEQARA